MKLELKSLICKNHQFTSFFAINMVSKELLSLIQEVVLNI